MGTRFVIASSPGALRAALANVALTATVEAEFGDECVEGTQLTMAHHGPRAGQPAPCSYPNRDCMECGGRAGCVDSSGCPRCGFEGVEPVEVVGLSHFDLDTLGGCAAILGQKPYAESFWKLAEFVDLRGPHRLVESGASAEDIARLHAFWAWSQAHRVSAPREGHADVTEVVLAGIAAVRRICADDAEMLAAGAAHAAGQDRLNHGSFVKAGSGVILRTAPTFVNHLYTSPDGQPAAAIVALNEATGAVTVSFADTTPDGGAVAIVQKLWGPLAGGHLGIAGSPRGQTMSAEDARMAFEVTRRELSALVGTRNVGLTSAAHHRVIVQALNLPGTGRLHARERNEQVVVYREGAADSKVEGLTPLLPPELSVGFAEIVDYGGGSCIAPIFGMPHEAREARAAAVARLMTGDLAPIIETVVEATPHRLGRIVVRGGAKPHAAQPRHPDTASDADLCCWCGGDTTGARQGFDCFHCGGN